MKTFIINLENETLKKEYILNECSKYNLDAIVIKAINGNDLSNSFFDSNVYSYPDSALTKGEIGCALSHLSIYQKMVDDDIKLALILEDDAILSDNINLALTQITLIDNPNEPDIYLLSRTNDYKEKYIYKNENFSIYPYYNASGAFAYVINKLAAKTILSFNHPIQYETDRWSIFRNEININTYCVIPHIAHFDSSKTSNLEKNRALMKRKRDLFIRKLTRKNKIKRLKYIGWKLFIKPFLGIKKTGY